MTKAAYRFFDHDEVTREALIEPHRRQTAERSQAAGDVVCAHDTTYLNFSSHPSTDGLGPIGTGETLLGLVVHNSLAVEANNGEVLGLVGQQVWAREGHHPKGETSDQRLKRARESQCWAEGIRNVRALVPGLIHVADREGDIFEVFEDLSESGERFVTRAMHNRPLMDQKGALFETVRQQPSIGQMTVSVPARSGQKKREALLTIRHVTLTVKAPRRHPAEGSMTTHVVEAFEAHAPNGCKPLHWVLLTGEPVDRLEACVRVIHLYKLRWKIEEFHMSLKTGCRIEERQLETRKRLEALLGLFSVVGVMLLRLRDLARRHASADPLLSPSQIKILRSEYKLGRKPNARTLLRAIAQLGGFLARKGDGEPGWRVIWRGMEELLLMDAGFHMAQQLQFLPSQN